MAYDGWMIVYCCADLIFSTKVRSTAEALGVVSRPVRDADMLRKRLEQVDDGKPNAAVSVLMVDLDAGESGLAMIEQAKAHNAALPVIAFGSHVATEMLHNARQRGADFVMPRGQFTATLPDLVQRFGTPPTQAGG